MEFNFDFNLPTKAKAAPQPLYAARDGVVADLGNGECLFRQRDEDEPHVMTHQVLKALDQSRDFRTLDDHVHSLQPQFPGVPADAIRRVFDGLVRRGLLESQQEFEARFRAADDAVQAPSAGLFIRACDRPEQLRTLLASLRDHEAAGGTAHAITVVDDSKNADAMKHQAALLAEFSNQRTSDVRHIDAESWRRFQSDLSREVPQHADVLDQLIGRERQGQPRTGPGRGWNLALLLGAGNRILFGDDDFVLPLRLHEQHEAGIELEQHEMTTVRFFTETDAAMNAGRAGDRDLIDWHLSFCGRRAAALFAADSGVAPTRAQWQRLAPSRVPRLKPEARIVATMNGHRGHSGSVTSDWMFALNAVSSRDLYQDRARYLQLIESAKVWMGPNRASLMVSTPFTPFAQDLSRLPAFVAPEDRGEDGVFGALSRVIEPEALILHLPTSIGHLRDGERKLLPPGRHPVNKNLNYFIVDFLARFEDDIHAVEAGHRLASAAARLEDLAAASDAYLIRLLVEYLQFVRGGQISRLQQVVIEAGAHAPAHWLADLQSVVKVNAKALLEEPIPRLAGWPIDSSKEQCAARLRDGVRQFAAWMRAWPDLFAAARHLSAVRG